MRTDKSEKLPCLLLPVLPQTLLLPTAAIVEIVPYNEPNIEILPDVPAWFVGMLSWRGIQIPLTILENMQPYLAWDGVIEEQTKAHNACHIAIINRITKINSNIQMQKFRQYPFFSIALKGVPKLFRISRGALTINDKNKVDPRFVMEVNIEENVACVPNLIDFWEIIDTLPSRLQWLGKIAHRSGSTR